MKIIVTLLMFFAFLNAQAEDGHKDDHPYVVKTDISIYQAFNKKIAVNSYFILGERWEIGLAVNYNSEGTPAPKGTPHFGDAHEFRVGIGANYYFHSNVKDGFLIANYLLYQLPDQTNAYYHNHVLKGEIPGKFIPVSNLAYQYFLSSHMFVQGGLGIEYNSGVNLFVDAKLGIAF